MYWLKVKIWHSIRIVEKGLFVVLAFLGFEYFINEQKDRFYKHLLVHDEMTVFVLVYNYKPILTKLFGMKAGGS